MTDAELPGDGEGRGQCLRPPRRRQRVLANPLPLVVPLGTTWCAATAGWPSTQAGRKAKQTLLAMEAPGCCVRGVTAVPDRSARRSLPALSARGGNEPEASIAS